ncbi:AAA family ATPase [Pseudogemmobacter sonorensis]|uniref:AAA family ATPase n=1 Tax=Pseudogemmobacter sonorensis TaxID=2989681 RepID=UPI0036B13129
MTRTTLTTLTEKLEWLEGRYWKFGHDTRFEEALADLYEVDDDGQMTGCPRRDSLTGETRGLMLLADSGSGKSAAMRRALRMLPALTDAREIEGGNTLFIEVPPEATIKSLAEEIATATGYPKFDSRAGAAERWEIARHRLVLKGIKTLIIDECHHIFRPGPGRDIPGAIQALKHMLQSDHAVALIIIGVPDLRDAILKEKSGETYRRFDEFYLPRIAAGSHEAEVFARCLASSARAIGVEMDPDEAFAERFLFADQGEAGRAVKLAKDTLRQALVQKRSHLSLADAERLFLKNTGFKPMTPFHPGDWSTVKAELTAMGWAR